MMRQEFELLAPAGSFEILKAVIEAGADAVYVGGSKYGARAYANNFTEEELLEAIDYVHLRGKKLFLTVNTLFKNTELDEGLYEYLLPYYERGLDAVIVQDLGVITFIQKHFPKLPIHTSTQMTVTGVEGAKLMKSLGVERVVLARELSIKEMQQICKEAQIELEAFIHGALCYSYSGQCLFSSMLGGRSGNRGRCAQPCRLSYGVLDGKKKEYKKESYVLSLKDLCGIEYLKQLREAGVYSLKIEGRMKQASYAAGVVSYYRKYIDLEKQVSQEDMQDIYALGNRCGFTSEYFKQHNDKSMITFEKPSYEKSNEELHQQIEKKFVGQKKQLPITGDLILQKGQAMQFYVTYTDGDTVTMGYAEGPEVLEARNKPLELEEVRNRMYKTGESAFVFKELNIQMEEGVFVPNGILNQLRRDGLANLQEQMLTGFLRETPSNTEEYTTRHKVDGCAQNMTLIASCESLEQVDAVIDSNRLSTIYVDSQMFSKKNYLLELSECITKVHESGKSICLRLPIIFRRHTAEFFLSILDGLKALPIDGFVVRNYEEIHFVSTHFPESHMIADHNLYTYNNHAEGALEALGVSITTIPLELNQKEIFGRYNTNSEMVVYGHYPLMVTAGCVHKNTLGCDKTPGLSYLKDRYKVLFPVKNFCGECYNVIYNSVPVLLFSEMGKLQNMDIWRFRLDFTIENGTEVRKVLDVLDGEEYKNDYTNGHYKRGVE